MAAHRDYSVFVSVDARSTMKNELETKAAKAVALPAYMVEYSMLQTCDTPNEGLWMCHVYLACAPCACSGHDG